MDSHGDRGNQNNATITRSHAGHFCSFPRSAWECIIKDSHVLVGQTVFHGFLDSCDNERMLG